MDEEGAKFEHILVDLFHQARGLLILPMEVIGGVIFLWLLWARLYRGGTVLEAPKGQHKSAQGNALGT